LIHTMATWPAPQACTGRARAKSQRSQAYALHLGKDGHALGQPEGPLAAIPQMVPEAPAHLEHFHLLCSVSGAKKEALAVRD